MNSKYEMKFKIIENIQGKNPAHIILDFTTDFNKLLCEISKNFPNFSQKNKKILYYDDSEYINILSQEDFTCVLEFHINSKCNEIQLVIKNKSFEESVNVANSLKMTLTKSILDHENYSDLFKTKNLDEKLKLFNKNITESINLNMGEMNFNKQKQDFVKQIEILNEINENQNNIVEKIKVFDEFMEKENIRKEFLKNIKENFIEKYESIEKNNNEESRIRGEIINRLDKNYIILEKNKNEIKSNTEILEKLLVDSENTENKVNQNFSEFENKMEKKLESFIKSNEENFSKYSNKLLLKLEEIIDNKINYLSSHFQSMQKERDDLTNKFEEQSDIIKKFYEKEKNKEISIGKIKENHIFSNNSILNKNENELKNFLDEPKGNFSNGTDSFHVNEKDYMSSIAIHQDIIDGYDVTDKKLMFQNDQNETFSNNYTSKEMRCINYIMKNNLNPNNLLNLNSSVVNPDYCNFCKINKKKFKCLICKETLCYICEEEHKFHPVIKITENEEIFKQYFSMFEYSNYILDKNIDFNDIKNLVKKKSDSIAEEEMFKFSKSFFNNVNPLIILFDKVSAGNNNSWEDCLLESTNFINSKSKITVYLRNLSENNIEPNTLFLTCKNSKEIGLEPFLISIKLSYCSSNKIEILIKFPSIPGKYNMTLVAFNKTRKVFQNNLELKLNVN